MSDTPDNSLVICPNCVHQFRAIPVDVQHELAKAQAEIDRLQKELDEAYERAAMIAEQHFIYGHAVAGPSFAAKCAKKIRALKSKTNL